MELIGHRGCAAQYPENTIDAVTETSDYLDTVEVDVRQCGTGELVVIHDETVDRVTDETGPVAEFSLAELRELDVLDTGEGVPTLEEILDALPEDVTAQVELKEEGLAAEVLDATRSIENDVIVSSFIPDALAELTSLDSTVETGLLFDNDSEGNIERAVALDCDFVHPHYDLCLDTDVVARAHAEGLGIIAWKAVETAEEVDALREIDIDGVTANRWDIE